MRVSARTWGCCALAGMAAACAAAPAQERDPVIGCWRLRGPQDSEGIFRRFPETVLLDSLPPVEPAGIPGARRVLSADSPPERITAGPHVVHRIWWRDEEDRLHLSRDNGHAWLGITFEGRGDTLRGEASTGNDVIIPGEQVPRWAVTAVRVPCATTR